MKKYLKGWKKNSCWDNSNEIEKLYFKRSLNQVEELTCHTQAASILKSQSKSNETLLNEQKTTFCPDVSNFWISRDSLYLKTYLQVCFPLVH